MSLSGRNREKTRERISRCILQMMPVRLRGRGPRKTHVAVQDLYVPVPVPDDKTAPMKALFRLNKQTMPQPVEPKPVGFPIKQPLAPSGQNASAPQTTEFVRFRPEKVEAKWLPNDVRTDFTFPYFVGKPVPYSLPV